jgi:hypothetical protein
MQNAAALIPLILYLYEKIRINYNYRYSLLAGIALGFQILAGHMQVSVYTYMLIVIYIIFYFFQTGKKLRIKYIILTIAPLFLSVLISLPQVLASAELAKFSWRGKLTYEFFTEYSFAPYHFITIIFPYLYGGGAGKEMWAPWAFSDFMVYMGILPILIATITFVTLWKQSIHIKFYGIISFIAVFLMLGKYNPLYKVMFYIPGYNMFRVPARNMVMLQLAVSILFAIGLNVIFNNTNLAKILIKRVLIGIATCFIIAAAAITALKIVMPMLPYEVANVDPFSLKNASILLPLFIIILSFVVVYIAYKYSFKTLALLIIVLVIIDIGSFAFLMQSRQYWLNYDRLDALCNAELYKIINEQNNSRTAFVDIEQVLTYVPCNLHSFNGYDPNMLKKYQILSEVHFQYGYHYNWEKLIKNNNVLSMCNVKYLATKYNSESEDDKILNLLKTNSNYRKIAEFKNLVVYVNLHYLPRVYFVKHIDVVDDINEAKKKIENMKMNMQEMAFIFKKDFQKITKKTFNLGVAKIISYNPNNIIVEALSDGEGFMVISEIYYPGWRAYVDGKEAELFEVNALLRGVIVPNGKHIVMLKYQPAYLYFGIIVSIFSFIIVIMLISFSVRQKNKILIEGDAVSWTN